MQNVRPGLSSFVTWAIPGGQGPARPSLLLDVKREQDAPITANIASMAGHRGSSLDCAFVMYLFYAVWGSRGLRRNDVTVI